MTTLADFMPKKRVDECSIEAYHSHDSKGQRETVLNIFRQFSPNGTYDRKVAVILSMEPSTVSARRKELIELGLLVHNGKVMSYTGKTVNRWKVKE